MQHERQKRGSTNQLLQHDHPEHQDLSLQLLRIILLLLLLYFVTRLPIIPAWPNQAFTIGAMLNFVLYRIYLLDSTGGAAERWHLEYKNGQPEEDTAI